MPDPLFSVELNKLYEAAGSPSVSSLVSHIKSQLAITGSRQPVPSGLAARIAEWKSVTTPREYTPIQQHLIQRLLDDARRRGALDGLPTTERQWRDMWRRTRDEGSTVETVAVCPYPGLSAFSPDDAHLFHGRRRAIEQLVAHAEVVRATGGLIVVAGASGAGKSSLLNAGMIPALGMPCITLSPGEDPVKSLLRAAGAPGNEVAEAVRQWAVRNSADVPVIVVDPAEDLFTVCNSAAARDEFMDAIKQLTTGANGPHAIVAFSLRADFISAFLDYPLTQEVFDQNRALMVGPLRPDDLHAAIVNPAKEAGLTLEPGLEDLIVRDLCGPNSTTYDAGALPMLSYALAETWRHRTRRRLTIAGYKEAGEVTGALAATAERTWLDLSDSQQLAAKAILLRLVNIGDGHRQDTRRSRSRDELLPAANDVLAASSALEALASARLISLDADSVALTHEILLRAWPRLGQWINDDRADLLARQRLERDAAEWNGEKSGLYAGDRLREARLSSSRSESNSLSLHARQFLDRSEKQEQRRRRIRQVQVAAAAVAVIVVAIAAAAFAFQAHQADRARFAAEQGQIIGAADRYQLSDPALSAQLLLAAYRRGPTDSSIYTRLLASQTAPLTTEKHVADGPIYTVAVSPNGQTIAAASQDKAVHLWQISDPAHPRPLATLNGHSSFVTSAAYSPNGQMLATTSDDETVRLWNLRDPAHPELIIVLTGHTGTVFNAAFSPDGRTLATVSYDRTIRLWDVGIGTNAHQTAVLTGSAGPVRNLAWAPNGKVLATGGDDNAIRLWDVPSRNELGDPLIRQTDSIHGLAWSPDGASLLSGSDDNTAQLWDVTNPATARPIGLPFGGHTGQIWSVAYSPTGKQILTTSVDGTAKIWSIQIPSRPVQIGQTLSGDAGQLFSGVWTPDARHVVTGAVDGMVRMWQLPTTVLAGHDNVTIPAISADHETMVSGSYNGELRLWNTADLGKPQLLDRTVESSTTLFTALSSDGTLAATALQDGRVNLRDIRQSKFGPPHSIPVPIQYSAGIALAPNGSWMAVISSNDSVELWDIRDRSAPQLSAHFTPDEARWITRLAASPDSAKLGIAQADGTISVWNTSHINKPTKIAGANVTAGAVYAIAFSSNNTFATSDSNIDLWKIQNGGLTRQKTLTGHDAPVRSVWFTRDGQRMISGGDNQQIYLWDTRTPRDAHQIGDNLTVPGPGHRVAAITGDAAAIILAGDNGFLQIEQTDMNKIVERICRDSAGYLDAAKWKTVAPSIRYSNPCSGT